MRLTGSPAAGACPIGLAGGGSARLTAQRRSAGRRRRPRRGRFRRWCRTWGLLSSGCGTSPIIAASAIRLRRGVPLIGLGMRRNCDLVRFRRALGRPRRPSQPFAGVRPGQRPSWGGGGLGAPSCAPNRNSGAPEASRPVAADGFPGLAGNLARFGIRKAPHCVCLAAFEARKRVARDARPGETSQRGIAGAGAPMPNLDRLPLRWR